MANQLEEVIPQLLAQGLLALRENAVFPRLVNNDYDTMAAQKGETITIPIPSAIEVQDVVPDANAPSTGDVAPTSASIKLDQWKEAPFYLTDKDMLESLDGTIPMQASEAIKALANFADKYLWALYKKLYGFYGTPGTTPFASDTTDVTRSRGILNKQLCPLSPRFFCVDPDAEASALDLRAFHDISMTGSASEIQEGKLNKKFGFNWYMDQNIGMHTAGTLTGDPVVTGVVAVDAKVVNLTTDADDEVNLLAGDIITFAGDAQTYVVGADVTIGNSSSGDVAITPGKRVATAGGEAVAVKDSHVVNLAMHRDCIGFATRPLADNTDGLGNLVQSAVDPVSGLTLRLEISREHKRTRFSYDILFGADVVRPEFGMRLAG